MKNLKNARHTPLSASPAGTVARPQSNARGHGFNLHQSEWRVRWKWDGTDGRQRLQAGEEDQCRSLKSAAYTVECSDGMKDLTFKAKHGCF